MKSIQLALTLLTVTALTAAAETSEQISKTLEAKAGGQLVIDVDFGSIQLLTHTSDRVEIDISRKVSLGSKSEEEEHLAERPVEITQEGSTITIRARPKSKSNFSWGGVWKRREARYVVTVPDKFNASLGTSGGGIQATGLTGELRARTSGGSLTFERIKGELNGNTSGGSISLDSCEGPIKVRTSGGGIKIARGSGTLDGSTSGGSIKVQDFDGPANVSTSGGGITLEDVGGEVQGSTSGGSINARLKRAVKGPVRLHTSGGSVSLAVDEKSAFDLDASTSGGGVRSDLPVTITGKPSRNSIKGPVNGGGAPVHLRTSGGSIHVKKL